MNQLHWPKNTGSFLNLERSERSLIADLGIVQENDFLFAEMLEKQKLQLRMQRK
jgi:hypothetical protein